MIANLAPVVLFVYNRPTHTQRVLEALTANDLAENSSLYIYADGLKKNVTEEDKNKIKETRNVIKQKQWCKEVFIVESDTNKGLANSIIDGITDTVSKYGKVIVLEDDLITGEGFLSYMNQALDVYADEEKVGCIHGWNYQLPAKGYKQSTFFLKGADCWGWATWQRAWNLFNNNGTELLDSITFKNLAYDFNRRNTHDFLSMLKDQIAAKNDSWAIRWHASLVLNDKYCLHPVNSLVKNIGLDGSGTHCNIDNINQNLYKTITLKKIPVEESEWFFQAYKNQQRKKTQWQKLKASLKQVLHL